MPDPSPDDRPPLPPVRPGRDDCCGGGCYPCVFELYDDAVRRYEAELAAWRRRNTPSESHAPRAG